MSIAQSYIFLDKFSHLYKKTKSYLEDKLPLSPDFTLITGSGIFSALENYEILFRTDYYSMPSFPCSTVEGHKNEMILVDISGKKLLVFTGRFHLYEGRAIEEVIAPIILSNHFGIKRVILTNSAGGLNKSYITGEIMLIKDALNFSYRTIGHHIFELNNKERSIFSTKWIELIKSEFNKNKISYNEGTYISVLGPNYETPSEIRFFRQIADAIGMSTYFEALASYLFGMEVVACSVISNTLNPDNPIKLSHQEVLEGAKKGKKSIATFISTAVKN